MMRQALTDCGIHVTFSSLVVEFNSRCNAKCSMCYQSAGPRGSELIGDHRINLADIERVLTSAVEIGGLGRRFHISGGESFLRARDLFSIFSYARDLRHFEDISTTTNAFLARRSDRAYQVARRAASSGVTMMEISWDTWHRAYISADAVSNCIDACAEHGIEPHLRLLTTRGNTSGEALAFLRQGSVERVANIHSCPVFSTGRAAVELDPNEFHCNGDENLAISGACHASLSLTVNARGDVYPCCAGADQTDGLSFGSIYERRLADIVKGMRESPLLRVLVFKGVSTFYSILDVAGIRMPGRYRNMCEFCVEVFSRSEAVAAVKRHFDDATDVAISSALKRWVGMQSRETFREM